MEIKRTFDLPEFIHKTFPKEDVFGTKINQKWIKISSKEYIETVNYVSLGLLSLGLKKGDTIATVSNNRPEWNFLDMGMSQIGVIQIPIYPIVSEIEYKHIFDHSESKYLFVHTLEKYNELKVISDKIGCVNKIYTFNKITNISNFQEIIDLGKENEKLLKPELEKIKLSITEDDICSIIYTSGTTGLSKGVMLTHKNFVSNMFACLEIVPEETKIALSFLPLCHVLERLINYVYQLSGISIYYAESMETVAENLKEIKPNVFVCVPRVLEKIYDKIYAKGRELKGIKRFLFFKSVEMGLEYEPNNKYGLFYKMKLVIFNKFIFSKWREVLGGNIKIIVSGGSALQSRLSRVFWAAGIKVVEGYGLTETSPVISCNRVNSEYFKAGSVGKLVNTATVKIAEDGEILFKGPNLMKGYFKDEEKTKEVIDEHGWFHTGDIGELDGVMLKITDRKKEIFKLSTGKYVAPQVIENKFKESPFIEQIIVIGENQKHCAAIICPSFEFLHNWASIHKIRYRDNIELIKNKQVTNRILKEIEKLNITLDYVMKIKKFIIIPENWTPESGELSPTLKLKRKFITEKNRIKISQLFENEIDENHGIYTVNIEEKIL